ncbi:MAG: alpha-glucosidase [Christiangramia sp.]|uniref:glycoside hydrolase family 13 protein n=1 Tax=Christiangramia sp. TaxID=1931228 RepID=UPI0032427D8E
MRNFLNHRKTSFCLILLFMILLGCKDKANDNPRANDEVRKNKQKQEWWKEAVVYQIYPRSFKDSDGDGIGDLRGLISKVDYIKSLNIDAIWLNPIFSSPNYDNGYDVSNFREIMEDFGDMEDFDTLINTLHSRGIKLVLDLVPNHTSSEHRWFKEARKSRNNPYRDYYHWWNAEDGEPPVRPSFHDESAWTYDKNTNSYYLHYFAHSQPDLNWENPKVRQEIYDVLKFWFEKGVDGFRMDVIPLISKDTTFPAIPEKYGKNFLRYYAEGPHLHEYLKEMNKEVLSKYDVLTVGEAYGVTKETAPLFVADDRKKLQMIYHFDGMNLDYVPGQDYKTPKPEGFKLSEFKKLYSQWDSVFVNQGWPTIYLGNHDQGRMVTRWGNDSKEFRAISSKMLTTFLLSMRGTPYYYFGDELGMNNIKFDNIEDYKDTRTLDKYDQIKSAGGDLKHYIETQKIAGRDNARTPFQWDSTSHAGFTSVMPWLKVNPNFINVNVAREEGNPKSPLNYFRKMVEVRKDNPVLIYGDYKLLKPEDEQVYAYVREKDKVKVLILLNFSEKQAAIELDELESIEGELINNYSSIDIENNKAVLKPYQALVLSIR